MKQLFQNINNENTTAITENGPFRSRPYKKNSSNATRKADLNQFLQKYNHYFRLIKTKNQILT